MSCRVFNPLVLSEMRRMIGRSSSDASPASVARVRRDLFGPVNHEDAQAFVDKELAVIRQRESEKWGFDFVKEAPIEKSRFQWERVTPEENFPEAYALRRLSFVGQQTTDSVGQTTTTREISKTSSPVTGQKQTTQKAKPKVKQTQTEITDFMKQRLKKRSLSVGDMHKVGSATGSISSPKVGTTTSLSGPSKCKRSRTRQ